MNRDMKQIDWSKWDSTEDCFAKYAHVKSKLVYGELPAEAPNVSIMIPTFRRADLLKEAIDSALNQKTRYRYTIAVIDNDAEGDEATDKLLKEYCEKHSNILYYRNEQNIGMFGNWNRCIELSQAEWLCMLHDDDMLQEGFVETLFPFAQSGYYGIVCCRAMLLDDREKRKLSAKIGFGTVISLLEKAFIRVRGIKEIPITEIDLAHGIAVASPAHLLRVSDAISCGGYNEAFYPITDIVFYQKIMKYYGAAYVTKQVWTYRICQNETLNLETTYEMLKKSAEWASYVQWQLGKKEYQCKKVYWEKIIALYNTYLDFKDRLVFEDVKKQFDIPKEYCSVYAQRWIVTKYILRWGTLLFKRSKMH